MLSHHTGFFQHNYEPQSACRAKLIRSSTTDRQAGKPQPTESLQVPLHTTKAGENLGSTFEGSEQLRDFCGQGFKARNKTSANHCLLFFFFSFTFLVHCLTVLTSSEMTMSTHLVQGSLIFPICLFTMVSKAMSGVKRPVLPDTERTSHRAIRRDGCRGGEKKDRRRDEGWVKRKELIVKIYSSFLRFSPQNKQIHI